MGAEGRKAVLTALAYRACDECGLCWPGLRWLGQATEISERQVRRILTELATAGHIVVRRYSRGGRGVSTEFVVLPIVKKVFTAPCGRCLGRMKTKAAEARP